MGGSGGQGVRLGVGMVGVRMDLKEVLKFWGKIKKKWGGSWEVGNGEGVRVDVNEELKVLGKFKTIFVLFFWGGGGQGGGVGSGGPVVGSG